jgi:hypothetical protein
MDYCVQPTCVFPDFIHLIQVRNGLDIMLIGADDIKSFIRLQVIQPLEALTVKVARSPSQIRTVPTTCLKYSLYKKLVLPEPLAPRTRTVTSSSEKRRTVSIRTADAHIRRVGSSPSGVWSCEGRGDHKLLNRPEMRLMAKKKSSSQGQ